MKKHSAFSLVELSLVILVIGIVLVGITTGSRMVQDARLNTARQLTLSSPVNDIEGITLWLETTLPYAVATGTTTFTDVESPADGTLIGRWNDINSNTPKKPFTQATSGSQPQFQSKGINNLPSLFYDPASSHCLTVASANLPRDFFSVNAFTVFVVEKMYGDSSTNSTVLGWEQSYPSNRFFIFSSWGGTLILDSGDVTNTRISGNLPTNYFYTSQIVTYRRADSTAQGWINGALIASRTNASGNLNHVAGTPFSIGDCGTYYRGFIGELIIFNRGLTTEERKAVERYLGKKWGATIS